MIKSAFRTVVALVALAWSASSAAAIEAAVGAYGDANIVVGSPDDGFAEWKEPVCGCDEGTVVLAAVGSNAHRNVDAAYLTGAPLTTTDDVLVGTIKFARPVHGDVIVMVAIDPEFTDLVNLIAVRAEATRALDHGLMVQADADDLIGSLTAALAQPNG